MKPTFNVGRALSFAFEVFAARPTDFILISVWTVLYGAVFAVIQIQAVGPELAALADTQSSTSPDEAMAVLGVIGDYMSRMLPYFAVGLAIGVVFEAAWLRLFVRGESLGIFPFRLGRDEGVYALSGLLCLLVMAVAMLTGWMAIMILTILFAIGGAAAAGVGVFLGFLVLVALLGAAGTLILPVPALSVLSGRVSLMEGTRGARSMFWPLLGSALVAVAFAFIANAIYSGIIAFLPFDQFGRAADGSAAGTAGLLVYYLFGQIIALVPAVLLRGVACYAALRIEEGNRPLSDTFR